ncbi:uncharacterized protein I303_103858 [Kwoniella dejecticola CBS 10117]|uniref:Uncharacterized protein n=1 Tax=Kwoniella dejecticola CBS 10117 TaxID=1296121 RepID=A0A1A6A7X5_9TREE|nr:uncharacterized protein I303_03877 [Kwoniella dejecticola CBS 10117]OBR86157.1 hypothetical protein I303_03877 [Kwoniella dejecticola CBS 10117]
MSVMSGSSAMRAQALPHLSIRAIHVSSRAAVQEVASNGKGKGKGKVAPSSLFAPISNPTTNASNPASASSSSTTPHHIPTSPRSTPSVKPTIATAHSRQWTEFENAWPFHREPSRPRGPRSSFKDESRDADAEKIIEVRTIFEKPINFNPFYRLFGCAFAAFIGFQWFWLPDKSGDYETLWNHKKETGYGSRLWGTFKHIVFVQTPFWALGGAAFGIWRLTKTLNIVTKLDQCRTRTTTAATGTAAQEVSIRMSTVKQALLKGLSGEPRELKMEQMRIIPVSGRESSIQ